MRWLGWNFILSLPSAPRLSDRTSDSLTAGATTLVIAAGCVQLTCCAALKDDASAPIAFGLSIAVALASIAMIVFRRRSGARADRVLPLAQALLAVVTIVLTAWTLPASAARWVGFGTGLAYVANSVCLLLMRGLDARRTVHVLEVRGWTATF